MERLQPQRDFHITTIGDGAMMSPDAVRWRALAAMLAVVAALAGVAHAVPSGTPSSATNVALNGEKEQHNQVLL